MVTLVGRPLDVAEAPRLQAPAKEHFSSYILRSSTEILFPVTCTFRHPNSTEKWGGRSSRTRTRADSCRVEPAHGPSFPTLTRAHRRSR